MQSSCITEALNLKGRPLRSQNFFISEKEHKMKQNAILLVIITLPRLKKQS